MGTDLKYLVGDVDRVAIRMFICTHIVFCLNIPT